MKVLYPEGSRWRKWDLHIHTPLSIIQNYGGDTELIWEKFIKDLESLPEHFKVIGINDYLFIDGYKKVLEYKQNQRLKNIDLILPLLEFRLQKFAGTDGKLKKINFHVIFSNDLKTELIEAQFINALCSKFVLQSGVDGQFWRGVITRESVADLGKRIKQSVPPDKLKDYGTDIKEGFNNLVLNEDDILTILRNSSYLNKNGCPLYLTAVGKTEWDSLIWTDQSIATKKDIVNKVHFVFTAAESSNRCISGKDKLKQNQVNDLLLDCSDAHHFSESNENERIGNCFTWIKGDPIFQGLEYILHEPSERVRFSEHDPNDEFIKPYFSQILIREQPIFSQRQIKFTATDLKLHSGLIAIIGGRGTGKSLLLDAIAKTFGLQKNEHRKDDISMIDGFSITYTKSTKVETQSFNIADQKEVNYIHVHQREVQAIVENLDRLSTAIFKMLGIFYNESTCEGEEEIKFTLSEINECTEWIKSHDKLKVQSIIDNRTHLISTITTDLNRQMIENYASNISHIKNNEKHISRLNRLKAKLQNTITDINQEINTINSELNQSPILCIDFSSQLLSIEESIYKLNQTLENLKNDNLEIKDNLAEEEIEGDPTTLLMKVDEYRSDIEKEKALIKEIDSKSIYLQTQIAKRNEFANQLYKRFTDEVNHINSKWDEKKEGSPDLDIEQRDLIGKLLKQIFIYGEIDFNETKFISCLEKCLNLRKFKKNSDTTSQSRIKKAFPIHSYDSFRKLTQNERIIDLDDCKTLEELLEQEDYFTMNGKEEFLNLLFSEKVRQNYLRTFAKIKYQDKTPEELSVGQRGTLFLSLKLATESFFDPIIIDQPEDDLDNQFIMNDLVPIFKTIKKYRQVIIATHNANLVVNADAEQVIVAKNESESLSYSSGSLENPDIRAHICNILEGGERAFKQREKKYGFRQL